MIMIKLVIISKSYHIINIVSDLVRDFKVKFIIIIYIVFVELICYLDDVLLLIFKIA